MTKKTIRSSIQDIQKTIRQSPVYFWLLVLLSISLPVSKFVMSTVQFMLITYWVVEGGFGKKLQVLKQKKSILLFATIFIVHVIGLIHTQDLAHGMRDLRIKLPLLGFAIIIGTSRPLASKQLKILLLFFCATVTVATFISMAVLTGLYDYPMQNIKSISIYISHIRFALMIDMSIFILVYYLIFSKIQTYRAERIAAPVVIVWLVIFLFILQSITGIVILFALLLFTVLILIRKIQSRLIRLFCNVLVITFPLTGLSYLMKTYDKEFNIAMPDSSELDKYTVNNRPYTHDFTNIVIDNQNFMGLYVCEKELKKEWNKRSKIPYTGKDKKGQRLQNTLIRYLTSKGLRKDSIGVSVLNKGDIQAIENGIANYIYRDRTGIYQWVYKIMWQVYHYSKGANPAGWSVVQRFEFLRTAFQIIKQNIWFGVGTGDTEIAFDRQYEIIDSPLPQKYRLRTHNQLVTFWLTLGVFGFLWIIFALIAPVVIEKGFHYYLFNIFFIISMLSMLNEDTLEVQAGVTFFAFFYSLLLFGWKMVR